MQAQQLMFQPDPHCPYKIVSVIDGHKAFTLQEKTNKLTIQDYKAAPDQIFHIYFNNGRYAFVNFVANFALSV